MKMTPLDIVDGSYSDEDKAFSAQDTVNYLPTSAEQGGTRTSTMLKTPPGLKPAILVGTNPGSGTVVDGPIRGAHNAEGRLFVVAGNTLYLITSADVCIPLGTIPGVGRVSFDHNQITGGNEVLINNGNAGYVYNTLTQTFVRITDDAYPGGLKAVFINNRIVQIEPSRRYAFPSDLANATSYNALDRFTSETSPDLMVSIESIGNQLAVFSTSTTEWFEDQGLNPQPFRSTQIVADKGCAGPFATAKMDNAILMLGDDGVFYRFNGYTPVRISTKPIEQAIRNKDWFNCFTTVWEDSGYSVCYWTFPDGETWGWDASSGKWHRRESYGFTRWRLNTLTYWRNAWYGGDFQSGRLWLLDWGYSLEGDQEFESIRACGVVHDNQSSVIHQRLELIMGTGAGETIPVDFPPQPEGPSITGDAPNGFQAFAWPTYAYTISGGTPPYAANISFGSLPPGIGPLTTAGAITGGVPTTVGNYSFTVRAVDSQGRVTLHPDSIQISNPVAIVYAAWPIATNAPSALYSIGGSTWSASTYVLADTLSTRNSRLVFYGGNRLYFFSEMTGATPGIQKFSLDGGATWTPIVGPGNINPVRSMCYTGNAWIIAGNGSGNYGNWRSTDGLNFTQVGLALANAAQGACIGRPSGTALICRRATGMAYSTDHGVNWTNYVMPASFQCEYLADTGTTFITAAVSASNTVYRSTTGASGSWISATLPASPVARGLAYGGGRAVLIDLNGQCYYSVDQGATWLTGGIAGTMTASNTDPTATIVYANSMFIVSGDTGRIYTSPDGITWTQVFNGATRTVLSITART